MPRSIPLFTILLLAFCSLARSDDWPQWRGPETDGHVPRGAAVPAALPPAPVTAWHQEVGFSLASPVVAGGMLFHVDDRKGKETLHALDAKTGAILWSAELDDSIKDNQSAAGPRTTPLASSGRMYAQSCRGQLKCFGSADGKLLWEKSYVKDFGAIFIGETGKAEGASRHGYTAAPLIDGDHLIAEVGGPGAGIVCFDKASGSVIWKSQSDMPAYASPIIATVAGKRQFIAFTAMGVIGLDPADGRLLWRVAVKTSLARHAATPVVAGDVVIISSHQAGLIGVKITQSGADFKGETLWKSKESAINFASPVVAGGFVYGVGPTKNLICIDPQTGKQAWTRDGFFSSSGGKTYAGMIVMDSNILILSDDGQLVLIAADPKEYREISRTQACGTNWCNPAYADGKLYLRDAKELRCLQLLP